MGLAGLRTENPWPAARPPLPYLDHGWFQPGSVHLLSKRINSKTQLIVELGSWTGQSTRWLLDKSPRACTVIAVDHWLGCADQFASVEPEVHRLLPILYDQFLANLFDYRDRLIPLRMSTTDGLKKIAEHGLQPDVVFIDADHSTAAVTADINLARLLFPNAQIVGDDWRWETVEKGVRQAAAYHEMSIVIDQNAWALEPL